MQQNKAKIFSNVISTEHIDKQPHHCIITPQPAHLLMPHMWQGLYCFRHDKELNSFILVWQTDNSCFRINPWGHCLPTPSAALLCLLKTSSAGWFSMSNMVRSSCVVLKSNPSLSLLTTCRLSSLGSFGVC